MRLAAFKSCITKRYVSPWRCPSSRSRFGISAWIRAARSKSSSAAPSRRVTRSRVTSATFAKAHHIIDCRRRERKHDIAEDYLAEHSIRRGLFMILVARAHDIHRPAAGLTRQLQAAIRQRARPRARDEPQIGRVRPDALASRGDGLPRARPARRAFTSPTARPPKSTCPTDTSCGTSRGRIRWRTLA
jgi:hypothetical protein